MHRRTFLACAGAPLLQAQAAAKKILIAHRGASAYAPEHTLPAYSLALKQGADYVEQDLQITKDGVLVCLHDTTLERTTDVAKLFPTRARDGKWQVSDFTLEEIKRLDAGSWFGKEFAGARVPAWQEAIDLVRGKAGIYPETKAPEVYGSRGFDMERLVAEALKKNGLDRPGADPKTPVVIQSFSADSLKKMRDAGSRLTRTMLINRTAKDQWLTPKGLAEVRTFADGIGPDWRLIEENPSIVKQAHDVGLTVTGYTFRAAKPAEHDRARAEMVRFLYDWGGDAAFTDNPDLFPRKRP